MWHLLLRERKAFLKGLGSSLIILPEFVQVSLPAKQRSIHQETVSIVVMQKPR